MAESGEASGLIARGANRFQGKNEKEASSILSTLQRHTNFLDSPRIAKVFARSDFRFADLKHGVVSVFLVLPPDRMDAYARWLRLMVGQAIQEIARDAAKPVKPILFLLDEFASLGHMAAVERAMGLMAGYGLQLWPILQDIHQLRGLYGRKAGTFLSNVAVLQTFNTNDFETASMFSHMLGQSTVSFTTFSQKLSEPGTSASEQFNITGRSLLTPDEIMTLPDAEVLLFIQGMRPVEALKVRYFADPEFVGAFDAV